MDVGILTQLKTLNDKLTLNQKLSIASLGALVLAAVLVFAYMVQREPYYLLFSDLDAANASSVVDRLRTMNVPHRLADGGRSVQVPADRIDQARIELAGQGLPTVGRMGFELFDQSSWGITDFAESVNYRRALEGELERSIISLTEIRQARVHLVMEKQSLFEEDSKPAKASVVVSVGGVGGLTRARTLAIRNLVDFSVEGLLPHNVTVVDVNGNLLSEPLAEEESLTDAQLGFRRRFEKDLCDKVAAILEPILGHENLRVSASVHFDFSETTEKLERVLDPVVISQQISRETVNSPTPEGIPFRANDPGSPVADSAVGGRDGRNFETETTNYEVSKSVRQTLLPSGGLLRQSVAVVVNDRPALVEGEDGTTAVGSRSPDEMERIRNLVAATIGLNADRGDTLIVENVSFSGRPEISPITHTPGFWEQNRNYLYPGARYLAILFLFGLFYLVIFRPVKRKVFAYVDVEQPQQRRLAAAMGDPELLKQLEEALGSSGRALPGAVSGAAVDKNAAMKKELLSLAKEDPQAVTHVIRSWLSEGV